MPRAKFERKVRDSVTFWKGFVEISWNAPLTFELTAAYKNVTLNRKGKQQLFWGACANSLSYEQASKIK